MRGKGSFIRKLFNTKIYRTKNNIFNTKVLQSTIMHGMVWHGMVGFINPRRMRHRVIVVSLSVCLSVCLSVTMLAATYLACKVLYGVLQICNVWISLKTFRSKVMALFAYHRCLPHSLKSSRWTEETVVNSF